MKSQEGNLEFKQQKQTNKQTKNFRVQENNDSELQTGLTFEMELD